MKGEIIYQARRLDSHPALAIWGGGNEVEASFRWFPDSRDNPQFYTPDYMQVSTRTCPHSFAPCILSLWDSGTPTALEGSLLTLMRMSHERYRDQSMQVKLFGGQELYG